MIVWAVEAMGNFFRSQGVTLKPTTASAFEGRAEVVGAGRQGSKPGGPTSAGPKPRALVVMQTFLAASARTSLRRQKLPRPCAPATSSRFARSTGCAWTGFYTAICKIIRRGLGSGGRHLSRAKWMSGHGYQLLLGGASAQGIFRVSAEGGVLMPSSLAS